MRHDHPPKIAPVPRGRAGRLWHLGAAAGTLAAGVAARGLVSVLRARGTQPAIPLPTPAEARRLSARLSRMRGAAIKLGQLLSLDGRGLLPPELAEVLAPLRDGAHAMSLSQVAGVLEAEYGSGR